MFCEVVRLVNDVKLRSVRSRESGEDLSVLNNRVAISDGPDETTFADITAWGGTAELIDKYFKKGDELYIEGYLRNKEMKIQDSEKKVQSIYILVTKIKFTHGKKKATPANEPDDFEDDSEGYSYDTEQEEYDA